MVRARVLALPALLVTTLGIAQPVKANLAALYAAQMVATAGGSPAGICHLFAGREDSTWEIHCRMDSDLPIRTVEIGNPPYQRTSLERLRSLAPGVYEARIDAGQARQRFLLDNDALPISLRRCEGNCFESQDDVEAGGIFRPVDQAWTHYTLAVIDLPDTAGVSATPTPGECDVVTTESLLGVSCVFDPDTLLIGAGLREGTSLDNVDEDEVLIGLFKGWQDPGHLTALHDASSDVLTTVRSGGAFIVLVSGNVTGGLSGVLGGPADPCHRTRGEACLSAHRVAVAVDDDMHTNETVSVRALGDTEALFTVHQPQTAPPSDPHVDVLVEVGCDAGQFVAAAMTQGFPSADVYNVTVTVTDRTSGASEEVKLTEGSRDGTVRFGSCP